MGSKYIQLLSFMSSRLRWPKFVAQSERSITSAPAIWSVDNSWIRYPPTLQLQLDPKYEIPQRWIRLFRSCLLLIRTNMLFNSTDDFPATVFWPVVGLSILCFGCFLLDVVMNGRKRRIWWQRHSSLAESSQQEYGSQDFSDNDYPLTGSLVTDVEMGNRFVWRLSNRRFKVVRLTRSRRKIQITDLNLAEA